MWTSILNWLIDALKWAADFAFLLLPDSPFQFDWDWGPYGKLIGPFFPVQTIAVHMASILTAYLAYYSVRWILRLIRAVQ